MKLSIEHITEYRYTQPAWDSFNELRLRPADDYRQTMLGFELEIEPRVVVRSHLDHYDNLLHHFYLPGKHDRLRIRVRSTVITYATPAPLATTARLLPSLRHRFFEYLAPTRRVPLDQDWFATFGALRLAADDELVGYLAALCHYLKGRFQYLPNATDVDTDVAGFAQTGAGVCQDYAHAMLAICRSAGVPSRYVSGYVHSDPDGNEDMLGSEGSHAWVETFIPGNGWVGFDPTNGCQVSEAHVKIGVGRDYDDVPPARGLRRGGGDSSLDVVVSVRRDETRTESKAAIVSE